MNPIDATTTFQNVPVEDLPVEDLPGQESAGKVWSGDASPGVGTDTILDVRGITVRFGGLAALDDVSFSIQRRTVFGLIGPNGAGKSTMFNVISGVAAPQSGRVEYETAQIHGRAPWRIARSGIARTFQNIRLLPNMSVEDNVLVARCCRNRSRLLSSVLGLGVARSEDAADRRLAGELLEIMGLGDRRKLEATSLPYADQRRLEIARAIALEPRLLLLDEPAAGMNTSEKSVFVDLINDIRVRFDLTVCIIEHHVPLVMGLCDRIAVLNFGRLIAIGTPAEIRHHPDVIEAYLGEAP